MLKLHIFIKIFLLLTTTFFLLSCEDTNNKQTLKEIAITRIANYADGTGPAPSIRNYEDAGIIGVNERNINELNLFIETLTSENINTPQKLKVVVDSLNVSLDSDIFAPEITIHGENPLTLYKGDTYTKVCADAVDKHDGSVTVYVQGDVNTNALGTYIVTYSAVDEAGNLASVDRVIHIVEKVAPSPSPSPSPQPNHYIHFTVQQDPYLYAIDVTVNNTSNNDSVTQHWVYPTNDPNAILTFTLATPLSEGENYNLEIPNLFNNGNYNYCEFSAPIYDVVTNGVMGNTDITLPITCFAGGA